jgi:hypothetical protein
MPQIVGLRYAPPNLRGLMDRQSQLQNIVLPILLQITVLPELSFMYVEFPNRFMVADVPSTRLMKVVSPIVLAVADLRLSDSFMKVVPPIRFNVAEVPLALFIKVVLPMLLLEELTSCPLQKVVVPIMLQVV